MCTVHRFVRMLFVSLTFRASAPPNSIAFGTRYPHQPWKWKFVWWFFFALKVKFATGISLVRYAYQNESNPEYVKAQDFLTANDNFVRDQIQSSLEKSDEYWQEMAIVWAQLDGLVAGNAATCGGSKCLDLNVFLFLQAEQELLGGVPKWREGCVICIEVSF